MVTWLQRLILQILLAATPAIAEELRQFARDFRERAKKTPNPWDDAAADLICFVLGVE